MQNRLLLVEVKNVLNQIDFNAKSTSTSRSENRLLLVKSKGQYNCYIVPYLICIHIYIISNKYIYVIYVYINRYFLLAIPYWLFPRGGPLRQCLMGPGGPLEMGLPIGVRGGPL